MISSCFAVTPKLQDDKLRVLNGCMLPTYALAVVGQVEFTAFPQVVHMCASHSLE